MKVYNKFSSEYDQLYIENIRQLQDKCKKKNPGFDSLVDFYPSFGVREGERCDLLFYGQAVNGWGTSFGFSEPFDDVSLEKSVEFSNSYCNELGHSPLDWVNVYWNKASYEKTKIDERAKEFYPDIGYSTHRSFFWNVVYKVTNSFHRQDLYSKDWSKKIVWSNLYKVAPSKANPSPELREDQFEMSLQLVKRELEELKPKYAIILTNMDWWKPFGEGLETETITNTGFDTIQAVEKYHDTILIVTTRPRFGNGDAHVREIQSAMNSYKMEIEA